jgi:hypothetical protein
MKIFEGMSRFTSDTIQVLVSGIVRPSANRKTGDMWQTYVVLSGDALSPIDAVKMGFDMAVCGLCKLRPIFERARKDLGRAIGHVCYVATVRDVNSIWRSHRNTPVVPIGTVASRGVPVRLGSYGEPTAVKDIGVWRALIKRAGGRHTGYTQQWSRADTQPYRLILMASVHSEGQQATAAAKGWRTFRTIRQGEPLLAGEILCPYPRVQCARCLLCDGKHGPADKRKNIAEYWH